MAVRIKPKRGTGAPTTSDLENNEIAMDMAAGKLYVNNGGTIEVLAEKNASADDTYTDAEAIAAVEGEATLDLSGDVSLANNKTLKFNNAQVQTRDITIEAKNGGHSGLVFTEENALTNNRRLDMIFRQTNSAGDTTHPIGSFDAVYSTTEADKRFQIRVMNNDGTVQANPHLEVRHTGDTVIRNNNLRFKEMDGTDVFTAKVNSSAVGGHDAQLYGAFDMVPEVTTETDLSLVQLKPDFGTNSIPDGAEVKLNFQIRNDTLGAVSLGRFSAVYDADDADKKFRMSSPDGNNSMEFFNSKTRLDSTVELDTADADKIRNQSGDLTLVNTSNGNSVVFKVDDAGGTTHTGLTVGTDDYVDTADATQYKSFIQNTGGGLKVGSGEMSSTGNTPDNGEADYEFNGVFVEPTGNTWPVLKVFSTGEGTGKNPVYDRLGFGFLQQYPQSVIQLGASEGTVASQSAITNGKRIGQLAFAVHDGSRLGGTNSISSATITTTAIEDAATTNARAVKMTIDFLPEGGTASDGDAASDRSEVLAMQESKITMKPGGEYGLEIDGDGVKPFRFFGVAAGGTDPSDPNDGEWFFNTTDLELKRYNEGASDWDIYTDEGWAFYDTTNNRFLVRQGTDWKPITLGTALT